MTIGYNYGLLHFTIIKPLVFTFDLAFFVNIHFLRCVLRFTHHTWIAPLYVVAVTFSFFPQTWSQAFGFPVICWMETSMETSDAIHELQPKHRRYNIVASLVQSSLVLFKGVFTSKIQSVNKPQTVLRLKALEILLHVKSLILWQCEMWDSTVRATVH